MRRMASLFRDDKGSTAVEFALVGLMFLTALLFTMFIAQILYFNQKLDFAVDKASRDIIVGNAQKTSPRRPWRRSPRPSAAAAVDVLLQRPHRQPVRRERDLLHLRQFRSERSQYPALTPGSGQFTLGTQGQYQYLQVIYPVTFLPSFLTSLIATQATYQGKPAYLIISTAAFRVEQY